MARRTVKAWAWLYPGIGLSEGAGISVHKEKVRPPKGIKSGMAIPVTVTYDDGKAKRRKKL